MAIVCTAGVMLLLLVATSSCLPTSPVHKRPIPPASSSDSNSPSTQETVGTEDPIVSPTKAPVVTNPGDVVVPALTSVIEKESGVSTLHVWRLDNEGLPAPKIDSTAFPKTVLAPVSFVMTNLSPQDAPNPLYDSSPSNKALRKEFLLDNLVQEAVLPDDPKMKTPEGLTVQNLFGKNLIFKKDSEDKMTVNGLAVELQKKLSDDTQVYVLDGALFDLRDKMDVAFKALLDDPNRKKFGPLGAPLTPILDNPSPNSKP